MCNRYSWIERREGFGKIHVLFLTGKDVYDTKRGKELQEYSGREDDYIGHGAIRFYHNDLKGGIDMECTDFSSPDNFPPELVKAIKLGKMRKLGCDVDVVKMITKKALAKIPALGEAEGVYHRAKDAFSKAVAAYSKVCGALRKARAAYLKAEDACDKTKAAYNKTKAAYNKAKAAYNKAHVAYDKASVAYIKAEDAYYEVYTKYNNDFWDVFSIKFNQIRAWR